MTDTFHLESGKYDDLIRERTELRRLFVTFGERLDSIVLASHSEEDRREMRKEIARIRDDLSCRSILSAERFQSIEDAHLASLGMHRVRNIEYDRPFVGEATPGERSIVSRIAQAREEFFFYGRERLASPQWFRPLERSIRDELERELLVASTILQEPSPPIPPELPPERMRRSARTAEYLAMSAYPDNVYGRVRAFFDALLTRVLGDDRRKSGP